ncbi:MAG: hypothetical protein QOK43_61 [Acidimicrobiaceae bacterium]|nr:hypothetical protein [Acidimicrobiaceae bacterium]
MTLRRAVYAAALVLALAVCPAFAPTALGQTPPPAPNDPGIGLRLLEAPTNRRDDPRAKRYIVDHVNAGTSFTRRIQVTNGTDRDVTVNLYAAAASLNNGDFIPASGHAQNDLSQWITMTPSTLAIPRGGRADATVTVAVPGDAPPGERYAVALAELPPPPGQGLVGLASRVGIRVYLSVGPGSEPSTDFNLDTFQPINETGKPGVSIHSCNTGGRALDLGGSLKLTNGPAGISAGPFTSTQAATIAPGTCEDLKILLDPQIPAGPWDATATLRSGTKEKTSQARITFPSPGGTAKAVKAHDTNKTSDSPFIAAAAVVAFLASGLGLLLFWRRRRRAPA